MSNILQRIMGGNAPAQVGHNNPPSDLEILQERLEENTKEIMLDVDELLTSAAKMPAVVDTEEQAGAFTDMIKDLRGSYKKLESTRVAEKEPYLALTRAVDGFFNVPKDKLEEAAAKLKKPLNAYMLKKADEERIERENEAKRLREEADARMKSAAEMEKNNPRAANASMVDAQVIEQQAQHAENSVNARPAELARSRGSSGAQAGLRTRWVGQLTDRKALDLEALRPYFTEDSLQKALNAAVNAGMREIKGANIIQQTDTVVR